VLTAAYSGQSKAVLATAAGLILQFYMGAQLHGLQA
jgi:hypothetical protein